MKQYRFDLIVAIFTAVAIPITLMAFGWVMGEGIQAGENIWLARLLIGIVWFMDGSAIFMALRPKHSSAGNPRMREDKPPQRGVSNVGNIKDE